MSNMADVRSLLRNERASRRLDHPHASYSATGTLECNVCHLPLKSDVEIWNRHLKSTQHAMRAERLRLSSKAPPPRAEVPIIVTETSNGIKKRKASNTDDDSRKRTRPVVSFHIDPVEADNEEQNPIPLQQIRASPNPSTPSTEILSHSYQSAQQAPDIDEVEWAAFERDVATPPPSPRKQTTASALMAAATISAAPLSAADIAAREKEEEKVPGKGRKEADLEAEKEDAARALEEEFDEMEGLEERVRKLREKREALRRGSSNGQRFGGEGAAADLRARSNDGGGKGKHDEQSEDEGDEDFDEWPFGQ